MKDLQLLGIAIVLLGSFLPLVHVPVIGNWNYWKLNNYLAVFCWMLCLVAVYGIFGDHSALVKSLGFVLIIFFLFTMAAVKYQTSSYFNFLPFKSWTKAMAGTVKFQWGWIVEFAGAFIILIASFKK
jgi:hypothetical protein